MFESPGFGVGGDEFEEFGEAVADADAGVAKILAVFL